MLGWQAVAQEMTAMLQRWSISFNFDDFVDLLVIFRLLRMFKLGENLHSYKSEASVGSIYVIKMK